MPETKKPKPKPKPTPKPKGKEKPKGKVKPKAKIEPIVKEKIESKVIVEITEPEKEKEIYSDKVKHLLFKIKNQNNYNDTGIRFAWKQ